MTRYRYDGRRKPTTFWSRHIFELVLIFLAAIVFAWILTTGSGKIWPVP